jgi:hypothetical protein
MITWEAINKDLFARFQASENLDLSAIICNG